MILMLYQPIKDLIMRVDVTYEEGPGVHDWLFWDKYIYKALQWLPLDDKSEGIHSGNVQ